MTMRPLLLLILIALLPYSCKTQSTGPIKEPAVAGAFYPADPAELDQTVSALLNSAARSTDASGDLIALIAPHAGYIYSARIAAYSYKNITRPYRTVIIIGSSHYEHYTGASVYTQGSFRTPLGLVRIDEKAAQSLLSEEAQVRFFPKAFEREHSIEVQLPFIQKVLPQAKIVPILMGNPTREAFEHLSAGLARLAQNGDVLIVASTDLSHYHNYETAQRMDGDMIEAILRLSVGACEQLVTSGRAEMCGAYAVMTALEAARRLGANTGTLYQRANSGDIPGGDTSRVVGYSAIGLYRDPLSTQEKDELLALARRTIEQKVRTGSVEMPAVTHPKFRADGAVFVTINRGGRLRGCIGDIRAYQPLYQSVVDNATKACSIDPRFPPMVERELTDMSLEISILSHLTPVGSIEEIEVGTHGLLLRTASASGLLLPQVPGQFGWDRTAFLEALSQKAGLPKDAWKSPDAKLFRFTADVFHEKENH